MSHLLRFIKNNKLLTAFFIGIFIFFIHPLGGDGDFFHHLNTGQYVLETHSLPQTDIYTFTAYGMPWVGYAWGTGLLFYILYSTLGSIAVSLFVALVAVITFILLFAWIYSYNIPKKTILLILSFAAPVLSTRWPNRPEIITYPFLVLLFVIDRYKHKYPKLPLLYPLIIIAWANMYGSSVLLGLIVIGVLIVHTFIFDQFKIVRSSRLFYIMSLFSFPISLINGYGLYTLFYIFFIPHVSEIQGEWRGIFFILQNAPAHLLFNYQFVSFLFFVYLLFVVITIFLSLQKIRRYPLLFILSLSLCIPFIAIRHITLAVILSLPLVTLLFSKSKMLAQKLPRMIFIVSLTLCFLLSLFIHQIGFGENKDTFREPLILFIKENGLQGKILNNQQVGAFLTYFLFPQIKVYSDTRDDLFANTRILTDYYFVTNQNTKILQLIYKYNPDFVLADLSDGFSYKPLFYSNNWSLVYFDNRYFLFVKKQLAQQKKLTVFGNVDPYSISGSKRNSSQF